MSWDTILNGNGSSNNNGEEKLEVNYAKLNVGVTKIRVIDEMPYSRWTHWVQAANGGKGQSVDCIGAGCPVCAEIKADKAAKRTKRFNSTQSHAINIYNHTTNRVEILDKGNKIFGAIATMAQQMGDPRKYDLTITRVGEQLGEINYTVLPVFPPTALPSDIEAKCESKYDIQALKKPLTVEQIKGLMEGKSMADLIVRDDNQGTPATAPNLDLGLPAQA